MASSFSILWSRDPRYKPHLSHKAHGDLSPFDLSLSAQPSRIVVMLGWPIIKCTVPEIDGVEIQFITLGRFQISHPGVSLSNKNPCFSFASPFCTSNWWCFIFHSIFLFSTFESYLSSSTAVNRKFYLVFYTESILLSHSILYTLVGRGLG